MRIPLYQIDAFTDKPFGGNPAAICPLDSWLDDATMQNMAVENNLSETAFFVGGDGKYDLRWFTPAHEVDLCGHATLASAHVVFNRLEPAADEITFSTRSGDLFITRDGDMIEMNFPARPPTPIDHKPALLKALGGSPRASLEAGFNLIVYDTADEVRELAPNMTDLAAADPGPVIVTAPGDQGKGGPDFVSRMFAPNSGIPEDPVTGSAHCLLVPYWSERLGKTELLAHQISARLGVLYCKDQGARTSISGQAREVLVGEFLL